MQHVKHDLRCRVALRQDRRSRPSPPKTRAQAREVGHAVGPEAHQLAVEDHPRRPELLCNRRQLRELRAAFTPGTRPQANGVPSKRSCARIPSLSAHRVCPSARLSGRVLDRQVCYPESHMHWQIRAQHLLCCLAPPEQAVRRLHGQSCRGDVAGSVSSGARGTAACASGEPAFHRTPRSPRSPPPAVPSGASRPAGESRT
jgi:hypothetical protein